MQTEWILGPPPSGDGEWIVETNKGYIFRGWSEASGIFRTRQHSNPFEAFPFEAKDIIRHMQYVPVPEPLKPFRRFNFTGRDGKGGTGMFDPQCEDDRLPFVVRYHGCIGRCTYSCVGEFTDNTELEWIDDEN